jgi:hypothetical protein
MILRAAEMMDVCMHAPFLASWPKLAFRHALLAATFGAWPIPISRVRKPKLTRDSAPE